MADKNVTFTGLQVKASTIQDMSERVKTIFNSSESTSVTPGRPATFADLLQVYTEARKAIFSLSGSFGSRTLNDFTGSTLSAKHGIGVVEATVGDLENTCVAFFATNLIPATQLCAINFAGNAGSESGTCVGNKSSFTAESNSTNFSSDGTCSGNCNPYVGTAINSTNFSAMNSSDRDSFTSAKNSTNFSDFGSNSSNKSAGTATNSTNCSGNTASNSANKGGNNGSNYSGNAATNSGNMSSGHTFNYNAFHTSQGGTKATVFSGNNKSNFSGNSASNSGNVSSDSSDYSGNTAANSGNFSGNTATNSSNFSGVNSGKRSTFTSSKNSGNFSDFGSNSTNRSTFTPVTNSTNFTSDGTNSTNRSAYVQAVNSTNFSGDSCASDFAGNNTAFFSTNTPASFSSNTQTCIVVHSSFRIEGVD